MKNFLHLVLFLPFIGLSQSKKVQADISTNDSAKLSILGVYQDDFPNISVVFKAERKNGNPVFGLKKSDMSVLEDKEDCQVISIQELSAKKPINIGIVLEAVIVVAIVAIDINGIKPIATGCRFSCC